VDQIEIEASWFRCQLGVSLSLYWHL